MLLLLLNIYTYNVHYNVHANVVVSIYSYMHICFVFFAQIHTCKCYDYFEIKPLDKAHQTKLPGKSLWAKFPRQTP